LDILSVSGVSCDFRYILYCRLASAPDPIVALTERAEMERNVSANHSKGGNGTHTSSSESCGHRKGGNGVLARKTEPAI
jgi:hypothetical protein